MSKKQWIIVAVAILLLLGAGITYYVMSGSGDTDTGAALAADKVQPDDKVMGDPKAPLVMIEYFAQACSVCSRFDQDVFPQLKAKYIDTGKLRYVMRFYPLLGPVDAAGYKLDLCVPPEHFFQSADLLFRNQQQWDSVEYASQVPDAHAGLIKMARIMGLSPDQADACMTSTAHDAAINKQAQDADLRYQVGSTGTPTLVVDFKKADFNFNPNDTPQNNWQRAQAVIDAALAAKGVK